MRFVYLFVFLFLSIGANAQGWLWARGNTGAGVDGWPVATDAAGNVFVAGLAIPTAPSVTFGNVTVPIHSSGYSSVMAKYDKNGNVQWAISTKNGTSWPINIAADNSGNSFLFGVMTDVKLDIGSVTLTNPSSTQYKYFLAKFDPAGNLLWAKCDGNIAYTSGNLAGISSAIGFGGISVDNSGNCFITSSFKSPSTTVGSYTLTNTDASGSSADIFVAKYDPAGNVLWVAKNGGSGNDNTYGMTVTASGDIYIAGQLGSPSMTFGSSTITSTVATNKQLPFMARYNASGTPVWACSGGGTGSAYAVGLVSDASNNVYLTGGLKENSISFNGTTIANPTPGASVLYLAKFDPSNNVIWYKTVKAAAGTGKNTWGYSIAISKCGVVWVCGVMHSDIDVEGHILEVPKLLGDSARAGDPIFVAGYTASGAYAGSAALHSGGDDQSAIACDPSGNLFLCSDYLEDMTFVLGPDTLKPGAQGSMEILYASKLPYINLSEEVEHAAKKTVCFNEGIALRAASGHANYVWNTNYTGPEYKVTDTGTFWVYGYDSCASSSIDTFKVVPGCDCSKNLFHPNVFTPNADGENDIFYPRAGGGITSIKSFSIYDRWGELLFQRKNIQPNDVSNAWDGTFRGAQPRPEVYVWVTEAVCESGNTIQKKGSITIVK